MKKFSIYQITDQSDLRDPRYGCPTSTFMYGIGSAVTAEMIANWYQEGRYELVAIIDAEGINDVFDIGNIGPEEQITRVQRMHSMSVGDIVIDENDDIFVVAPRGYDKLNVEETV